MEFTMKHLIKKLLALCLVAVIAICCIIPAAGASSSDVPTVQPDYTALFKYALTSNSAESEVAASKLADAFDTDANSLVKAMSQYTSDEIETIAYLLTYGKSYQDLDKFKSDIVYMLETAGSDEAVVLEAIHKVINSFQYFYSINLPDDSKPIEANVFDPETILNFIELNEENGNVDEEYFHTLGNAYRTDPKLFASMISKRSDDSIAYIAKAVAYDCINHSDYTTKPTSDARSTIEKENKIINIIESAIADESNGILSSFFDVEKPLTVSPLSTYVPTIGTMTYTSAPLYVGASETLNVTFSESSHSSVQRTYYTEVYAVRNGVEWLKSSKSITIPAGSTSTTVSYSMSFSDTGVFYTLVKVYSSSGGSLLASRQGTYSDTIYGKWKITVALKTDRTKFGTLTLYNAGGTSQMSVNCLGLSASGDNMYTYYGNTPTGTYTGYLYGPVSPSSSYGPYKVVAMDGVSGAIITSGRSGIWIHGGDAASSGSPTYPLRPTNGCVRISNANQNTMATTITSLTNSTGYHDSTGNITISESA
jgi:hypothetical protein